MFLKSKGFLLCIALLLGAVVLLLPRPEGDWFEIAGDTDQVLLSTISEQFTLIEQEKKEENTYSIQMIDPKSLPSPVAFLEEKISGLNLEGVEVILLQTFTDRIDAEAWGTRWEAVLGCAGARVTRHRYSPAMPLTEYLGPA